MVNNNERHDRTISTHDDRHERHEQTHEQTTHHDRVDDNPANRDPLSGQPGAHPVGTGVGAAATGVITTAIGATGGPVGALIGAVVGTVIGGLVGKSAAERVNPTVEESYWRDNYRTRPYYQEGRTYEDYEPAFQTGYEGYRRLYGDGRRYEDVETELQRDYEQHHRQNRMPWDDARHATRDAWNQAHYNAFLTDQDDYWRNQYLARPYYVNGMTYNDYQPAYRMGYEGYVRHYNTGRTFEQVEPELRQDYEHHHGSSRLAWEQAKHAVRDGWERLTHSVSNHTHN